VYGFFHWKKDISSPDDKMNLPTGTSWSFCMDQSLIIRPDAMYYKFTANSLGYLNIFSNLMSWIFFIYLLSKNPYCILF
jgi:hypothetical protein